MKFCPECIHRAMCNHYAFCVEGRVIQPEHEIKEEPFVFDFDRDKESRGQNARPKGKKARKSRAPG